MSTFVYIGDLHLRSSTPRARVDSFKDSILELLQWIVDYSNATNLPGGALIFGGDIFHAPDQSASLISSAADILKQSKYPVLTAVGNHDIVGNYVPSYKCNALGLLERMDVITVNSGTYWKTIVGNITYHVFNYDVDWYSTMQTIGSNLDSTSLHVGVCHAPVGSKTGYGELDVKDLNIEGFDLVCFADIHTGFPKTKIGQKTYAINPGAVERLTSVELNRKCQIAFIDFTQKPNVKYIDLPVKSAKTVFKPTYFMQNTTSIDKKKANKIVTTLSNQPAAISVKELLVAEAKRRKVKSEIVDLIMETINK